MVWLKASAAVQQIDKTSPLGRSTSSWQTGRANLSGPSYPATYLKTSPERPHAILPSALYPSLTALRDNVVRPDPPKLSRSRTFLKTCTGRQKFHTEHHNTSCNFSASCSAKTKAGQGAAVCGFASCRLLHVVQVTPCAAGYSMCSARLVWYRSQLLVWKTSLNTLHALNLNQITIMLTTGK